ncbi:MULTISPECIES: hypothetical protein [Streptomyces]|jgi:hypothetical protein|uniref:Uncharacterized protein n=1 Tax=Streptomyces spinosisporus TaxID=2927582 RepID=A0ABS9XJP9_9ACTN|nr:MULTISPECIES: hypothetical protein [Streptomyces]MCI3241837.1 hypothetical protein [Streptomyces spinosisporus]WUB33848.1 hypothetical protein OHN38_02580 [Streptomyces sp. NBC_00588]
MTAVVVVLQLLILAGALYDTVRLLAPAGRRRRPCSRLRRRRLAPEAAERQLVAQRLHGLIGAAAYRESMAALANGRRPDVR